MKPELPPPMTPADCDLNGLEFMPLEVNRVMQSSLFGLSTGDEFKAAFALWCASWYECPAGSLPNDERMLEYLSKSKHWKRVRSVAMKGWTLCADGRLYHETVAKVAMAAWDRRVEHREENDNKNDRQRRWRERCKHLAEQLRSLGVTPPRGASLETLERLLVDTQASTHRAGETHVVTSTVDGVEIGKTGEGRTGEDRVGDDSSSTSAAGYSPPPFGDGAPPAFDAGDPATPKVPPCPHLAVLKLWAEVLPSLPQHDPDQWNEVRRKHLQTRWRETAASKQWKSQDDGLAFFRRLFVYVGKSAFLTGRAPQRDPNRPPFVIELEWLLLPTNWAKVIEGKYHQET